MEIFGVHIKVMILDESNRSSINSMQSKNNFSPVIKAFFLTFENVVFSHQ